MAAIALPPPLFFTVADLAQEWGCHPERVHALAESGLIEMTEAKILGAKVLAVSFEERKRFEKAAGLSRDEAKPINPTERRTLLNLVGALAYIAYGREDMRRPYALAKLIEKDAAVMGLPLEMGRDTLPNKLKESFALMRGLGCEAFTEREDDADNIAEAA